MTPILILAYLTIVLAALKDGKVLLLNKGMEISTFKSDQIILECSKCDEFYQVLRSASDMIVIGSPGMSGVPVAKIDLTNDTNTIKEMKIQGFPTTRFYVNGSYSVYDGEWDSRLMQQWIEDRTGLYVSEQDEEIFLNGFPQSGEVCVMFFHPPLINKNDTIPFLEEFRAVSRLFKQYRLQTAFGHTSLEVAKGKLNVSKEIDIVLWTNRGAYQYFYKGEKSIEAVYNWLSSHRHRPIMTFTEEDTIQTIFYLNEKKLPILFLFSSDKELSEGANFSLALLEKQYKRSVYFVYVPQNESDNQYNRLVNFLGVKQIKPPFAVIYNQKDQQKKYRLQTSISPEVIKKFVEDYFSNKLTPFFKSQIAPPEQNNKKEIIEVVGTTFEKNVINQDKHVLVYYYASWCQVCQKFSETYQQLFELYKEKIIFAKFDGYENEIPSIYIDSFPMIKLYKKGQKGQPIEYKGKLGKKELQVFLNNELKLKVKVHDDL